MPFSCTAVKRISSQGYLVNIILQKFPLQAVENNIFSTYSEWNQISGEQLQVKSDSHHSISEVTWTTSETLKLNPKFLMLR